MIRTCRVRGCQQPTSSQYSAHCRAHKARLRRHGSAEQTAVTKTELAPYAAQVAARIQKNQESPLWAQLDARWTAYADTCRALLAASVRGKAGVRYQRIAADLVAKLGGDIAPREIVVTALAMYLLQADRPHRFQSEASFRAQLVRRIQFLGSGFVAKRYDHTTGRQRLIYRESSPKGVAILGHWLATAFGATGLRIAELEREDRSRQDSEREAVREAITELT